jgi:PIN domain nuclease of toxin-antitoxin system
VKLLLDTHIWLWMLTAPDRLGVARDALGDHRTELFLSAASTWEIAIKHASGRLPLPEPPTTYVPDRMRSTGVTPLAVTTAHTLAAGALPPLHRDPFDRLLLAQAESLGVRLVTADRQLAAYGTELFEIA